MRFHQVRTVDESRKITVSAATIVPVGAMEKGRTHGRGFSRNLSGRRRQ